jgi:hypothetical protein
VFSQNSIKTCVIEVSAAVIMTIQAFWDVKPCRLANSLTDSFKGRGVFANHLFFD